MVERLYTPHSLLGAVPAGVHHAWSDPEEQFEWNIMTRRRTFRNLCTLPGEFYSWAITNSAKGKKPLFPDLTTDYANPGKFIDSSLFTGIIFKQALDIGAKFGLSSFARTATLGYQRSERFRELLGGADELLALAQTAALVDPAAAEQAAALNHTESSPLHSLYAHSQRAGHVLAQFAQGTLPVTAENLALLEQSLESMAQICDAKSGLQRSRAGEKLAASLDQPAGEAMIAHQPQSVMPALYEAHNIPRPSEPVRKVLSAAKLTSPQDAARYLATLSAVISDAAFELETDIYRPRDQLFITASQARDMATTVSRLMSRHQLQLNHGPQGAPLRADLPAHAMLKATPHGFDLPAAADILALANETKAQLAPLNPLLDRMLAFADAHYAKVNGLLAHGTLSFDKPTAPAPTALARTTPTTTIAPASLRQSAAMPQSYYANESPGLSFVVREQARHEMWKLYGRSLPTYLYQAPINLIERLILPNTKGKWEFNSKIVASETKAAGWMAFYYPLAESFGGVATYEATRLGLHETVQQAKQMDNFLAGAVAAAQAADPAFAQGLEALRSKDDLAGITRRYHDVLSKPAAQWTEAESQRAAGYFHDLAQAAKDMALPALQLLAPHATSLDDVKNHCHDILMQGARSVPDAMQLFTLLRFVQEVADDQILSLEYVDPKEQVVTTESLKRITSHVMQLMQKQGFALVGQPFVEDGHQYRVACGELPAGTLVQRNSYGSFNPLSPQDIVGFANQVGNYLRSPEGVDIPKLFALSKGQLSDQYVPRLEQELLHHATLPALPKGALPQAEPAAQPVAPASLHDAIRKKPAQHAYWQEFKQHVTRPEAVDEMSKLRDRYLFVSLFGFPVKIATNILRGDFDKIGTAFGKWSLASTGFAAVANTLAPSYGAVAMREIASMPGQLLISDAGDAGAILTAAIGSAGVVDAQIKSRFAASSGINPLLGNTALNHALEAAAPILCKPDDARSAADQQTLEAFVQQQGDALLGTTLAALHGSARQASSNLTETLSRPARTVEEAVERLAWVQALVQVESRSVNVLRYEGVSHRIIDDKGLATLVHHINNRAYTEGFSPQRDAAAGHSILAKHERTIDAPTLIAFANDVSAVAHQVLSEKLKTRSPLVQQELTQRLTDARQQAMTQAL